MTAAEGQAILDRAAFTAYFHPVNLQRLARAEQIAQEKGLSVPQIAVAYVMGHPLKIFSLQSPRTLAEMRQNDQASDLQLTSREMAWLNLEV
jgi:aryl-alcohol dehydrogenase-like predicted oxidoreductase